MSRTFRHRRLTPKGWVVRDGGSAILPSCCPNNHTVRKSWRFNYPRYCECQDLSLRFDWLPNVYRKERKEHRKADYRQYKRRIKDLMRHERFEDIYPYHKTGGWLTW